MAKKSKADRFIDILCAQVGDSAAVSHPYLTAISTGNLPNIDIALQDFAFQYGIYNAKFTRYVAAVIANLRHPKHQLLLRANLAEEQGDNGTVDLPADVLASIVGRPHSSLYQRFQAALGVDAKYARTAQPCPATVLWARQFHALCKMNECVGVGAIGIGTELIVSRIYEQILQGLKAHSTLTMTQRVFFDLHSHCDDEHAAQMRLIAADLAEDASARKQLEYGAMQAVELRVAFWDEMLARAQCSSAPGATTKAEQVSALAN